MESLTKECSVCGSENIQYKETETQYGYYCNDCYNFGVYTFKEILGICCKKPKTVIYELTQSNGVSIYRNVCLNCWDNSKNIKKDEALKIGIYDKAELSAINQLKDEKYYGSLWSYFSKLKQDEYIKRKEAESEKFRKEQQDKSSEWWQRYKEYLKTDKWQKKRLKVLERDKNLCQACLVNTATQVHHLTYQRVTDEPMFDLISICSPCHEKLHKKEHDEY